MPQKKDMQVEIAKVAYELFEKSGRRCGCEVDNWLAAEKIVMERYAKEREQEPKVAGPAKEKKASAKDEPKAEPKAEPKTVKAVKKTSASSPKTTKKKSPLKK